MRLIVPLLLGALFSAAPARAESPAASAPATQTFLLIYRPGPAWVPGKGVREQPLKEHFHYMLDLYANGTMTQAGPLTDDAGGAVVLQATDLAAARAIADADPAVKSGVFVHELHPWLPVRWDEQLEKRETSAPR